MVFYKLLFCCQVGKLYHIRNQRCQFDRLTFPTNHILLWCQLLSLHPRCQVKIVTFSYDQQALLFSIYLYIYVCILYNYIYGSFKHNMWHLYFLQTEMLLWQIMTNMETNTITRQTNRYSNLSIDTWWLWRGHQGHFIIVNFTSLFWTLNLKSKVYLNTQIFSC